MSGQVKIDKLSSFCKVISGQSPKGSTYNEDGIGVEFHQGKKAFGAHTIEPSNVWTTEITKLAQPGDILMSVRAPVGPTNFTDREVCIGRGLAAIRCKPDVLPQYILYVLKCIESKIVGKDGAVFNSINKDMIEDLPVPAVDKIEQQRIVDILDQEFTKIDALKANAEKSLLAAKDLYAECLNSSLSYKDGWKTKTLDEVCSKITDGTHNSPPNTAQGEFKYITAKNIKPWGLDLTDITFVSADIHRDIFSRCNPCKGDVLYIKDGATTGIAILNPLEEEFSLLSSVALLKPLNMVVSSKYLCYAMNSPTMYAFVRGRMDGAAITRITLKKIKEFPISFPPLEEQDKITARLDDLNEKCNALQENYLKTLALCDDLKQALLRKAFNGEL